MGHLFLLDEHIGSPTYGQEVVRAVTVVETPPMTVCGARAYQLTSYGLKPITEVWTATPPKGLERSFTAPKTYKPDVYWGKLEASLQHMAELRAMVCAQPRLSNVPQKKPVLFEVKVDGGELADRLTYLKGMVGKTVKAAEVFEEGQYLDVIGVTKGKGVQGPVKRWGVKKLPHKSRKTVRGVGTLGPWSPHYVMYTVPRAGQMGFHQRTEINKRVLRISDDGEAITPKGGFPHYGVLRGEYMLIDGSVPGPARRFLKLRFAARPPSTIPTAKPNITHLAAPLQ
jgi:large subunit ribosomal protein L3